MKIIKYQVFIGKDLFGECTTKLKAYEKAKYIRNNITTDEVSVYKVTSERILHRGEK